MRRTSLSLLVAGFAVTSALAPGATALATGTSPAPAPGFAPAIALFNAAGASTNGAEPSIAVDSQDNVFVSAPAGVPTGGCPFWSIHPDRLNAAGKAYEYRGTIDTDHGSVGGGDCDISTTPVTGGNDSVSVTSLSLANLTSNVTTDLGATFKPVADSASQQVFGVDREWQASDAALGRHYLSVHDLETANIQMSVSTDGGYQYVQNTPAIDPTKNHRALSSGPVSFGALSGTTGHNHFGTTVVDPLTHKLYVPFLAPLEGSTVATENTLYIAEGDPCASVPCTAGGAAGPISWTSHQAFTDPTNNNLSNDFPSLTIDKNGVLYAAFTGSVAAPAAANGSFDTNRIFVLHATAAHDANAWSAPQAVDPGTANSNVFPWLVAGTSGNVGIAWYASTLVDSPTCPGAGTATNAPVSDNCHNVWHVAYAQSSNANSAAPSWTVTDASNGPIHKGPICNQGLGCATGTRTMLDFFDVALDSQGRPNIAYVSDIRSLDTADVQYTRQCSGTSLTDTAQAGCVPIGATSLCGPDAAYTDPAGDATGVLGKTTPGPNQAEYDIVSGRVATSTANLFLQVHLNDLTTTPNGIIVETHFKVAGKEYYVMATRPSTGAAPTYTYGDLTGTNGGRKTLGTGTGSFNDVTDVVAATVPRSLFPGSLADGTLVTGVVATTRIDGQALIPDVDTAGGACSYTAGAAAPEAVVPEVPYAALVPLVGLSVIGATFYRRRRKAGQAA
jgi:hypothetical protein